ncbi:MAG: hypothetical protein ACE5J9_06365 [Methanosarcinales archaeon]
MVYIIYYCKNNIDLIFMAEFTIQIDDLIAKKFEGLATLWNLNPIELARKALLDGFKDLQKISLELALKKVEEGKAEPEDMAKLLGMDLEEFEDIAVERGIIDDMTLEELQREFDGIERLKKIGLIPCQQQS